MTFFGADVGHRTTVADLYHHLYHYRCPASPAAPTLWETMKYWKRWLGLQHWVPSSWNISPGQMQFCRNEMAVCNKMFETSFRVSEILVPVKCSSVEIKKYVTNRSKLWSKVSGKCVVCVWGNLWPRDFCRLLPFRCLSSQTGSDFAVMLPEIDCTSNWLYKMSYIFSVHIICYKPVHFLWHDLGQDDQNQEEDQNQHDLGEDFLSDFLSSSGSWSWRSSLLELERLLESFSARAISATLFAAETKKPNYLKLETRQISQKYIPRNWTYINGHQLSPGFRIRGHDIPDIIRDLSHGCRL